MLRNKSVLFVALFALAGPLQAQQMELDVAHRAALGVTVYNSNLALINDSYRLDLVSGRNQLDFSAISPQLNQASAVLRPLADDLRLISLTYARPLTPEHLLQNAVGTTVSLISQNPVSGEQIQQRAHILSVNQGLIMDVDGHIETDLADRRIVYDQLPSGTLSPTLSVLLESTQPRPAELTLSYLTGGFSWRMDYVATLNKAGNSLDIQALATLSNQSGMAVSGASIDLMAGEVNKVPEQMISRRAMAAPMAEAAMANVEATPMANLHHYKVPGVHDLPAMGKRQLVLFEARDVPAKRRYKVAQSVEPYYQPQATGEQQLGVESSVELHNEVDQHLGFPLPAGIWRLYTESNQPDPQLVFIGEDRLGHTPKQRKLRINTGRAFDLGATRSQTAFRKLPVTAPYDYHSEVRYRTVFTNAGDEAVTIELSESFSGEWVQVEGPEPEAATAYSARWNVEVPPQGETVLLTGFRIKR